MQRFPRQEVGTLAVVGERQISVRTFSQAVAVLVAAGLLPQVQPAEGQGPIFHRLQTNLTVAVALTAGQVLTGTAALTEAAAAVPAVQ